MLIKPNQGDARLREKSSAMAHITTDMIWSAQQQAYAEVAEARRAGNTFTLIDVRDGRGIAFIDGARSFENARQMIA